MFDYDDSGFRIEPTVAQWVAWAKRELARAHVAWARCFARMGGLPADVHDERELAGYAYTLQQARDVSFQAWLGWATQHYEGRVLSGPWTEYVRSRPPFRAGDWHIDNHAQPEDLYV